MTGPPRATRWEGKRALLLAVLVSQLSAPLRDEVLQDALAAARTSREEERAQALIVLVPSLSGTRKDAVLREVLDVARVIEDEEWQAKTLVALAADLPPTLLTDLLTAVRAMSEGEWRAKALANLAPVLIEPQRSEVLEDALATARSIVDEGIRAHTLAVVAHFLPEARRDEILREALVAARATLDEELRKEALVTLAQQLPAPMVGQALDIARTIVRWDRMRGQALGALAARLAELGDIWTAVEIAEAIGYTDARTDTLAALAPHLAQLPLESLQQLGQKLLTVLAAYARRDLLRDLPVLVPVLSTLGGREAIADTTRAILAVAEWWP